MKIDKNSEEWEEGKQIIQLAWPVTLTVLASMSMQVVDTLMVGGLGDAAIAALSLAGTLIFSIGVLPRNICTGVEPLVSQAFGAKQWEQIAKILQHALISTGFFLPAYIALMYCAEDILLLLRQKPELAAQAGEYCRIFILGIPFELSFFVLAKWLQGQKIVKVTTVVVFIANVVNIIGNYLFIYQLEYGVIGSAMSTVCCIIFQLALLLYLSREQWLPVWRRTFEFDIAHLKEQISLGIPASLQISFECWGFTASVFLVGWMGELRMAAHAIALNIATVMFMIPLGLSAAASTRVGNRIGEGRSWTIVARLVFAGGIVVQMLLGGMLYLCSSYIVSQYTSNPATILLSIEICAIVALFQIFDGAQVVGFGVLRGMADMTVPAVLIIVCHWLIGLPVGYLLAFPFTMGLHGIWIGLSISLATAALAAWLRIVYMSRRLT